MADLHWQETVLKAALFEYEQALDAEIARFEQGAVACVTTPALDARIQALISGKQRPQRRPIPGWVWAAVTAACLLLFIGLGSGAGLFRALFGAGAEAPATAPPAQEAAEPSGEAGEDAGEPQPVSRPGWLPAGFTATAEGSWANEAGQYIHISTDGSLTEGELARDKSYEWLTLANGLWYLKETGGEWELICYAPGYPVTIRTDLLREEALKLAENLLFT